MKEEACRNSVHCNNTEFTHRAFLYFIFIFLSVCVRFAVTLIMALQVFIMTCANPNGYSEETCKYSRSSSCRFTLVTVCFWGFFFVFVLFVRSFFEGRRREGTIQDFSMIHRYFSTNLNQMILYTVE